MHLFYVFHIMHTLIVASKSKVKEVGQEVR